MSVGASFNTGNAGNVNRYGSDLTDYDEKYQDGTDASVVPTDYGEVPEFNYEEFLKEHGNEPEFQEFIQEIEAMKTELLDRGITERDISRLINDEISIEALIEEIENDPDTTRKRKIYEIIYVESLDLGDLGEYHDLASILSRINVLDSQINAKQAQIKTDELNELNATVTIIQLLMEGYGLDSVLDTAVLWQYVDKNGQTQCTYIDPYMCWDGETIYTPITYRELCGNSEIYTQLRNVLDVQHIKPWIRDPYDLYLWTYTDEQYAFLDSIFDRMAVVEAENAKLEAEIEALRNEQTQLRYIYDSVNHELDYYMTYVAPYLNKPDFNVYSHPNYQASSRAKELGGYSDVIIKQIMMTPSGPSGIPITPRTFISGTEDTMAVVSSIINKEGIFSGGRGGVYDQNGRKVEGNSTITNFACWACYMSEEEVAIFNYLYNSPDGGATAAMNYLESISDELDDRWVKEQTMIDSEWAKDNPFWASVGSVFITPFEGLSAAGYSLSCLISGEKIRQTHTYSSGDVFRQAVSEDIRENYGEGWAFIYSTGMSMADSLVLLAATYATGGLASAGGLTAAATKSVVTWSSFVISATWMGSRAYVTTLNDALGRGLSDGAAVALAFSSAAVETLMESYSVGHLMHLEEGLAFTSQLFTDEIVNAFSNPKVGKFMATLATYAFAACSQGLCEGEEELCTEIVNYIVDEAIAGKLSNHNLSVLQYMEQGYSETEALERAGKDFHYQLEQAFLGGFVSGVGFGFLGTGVQRAQQHISAYRIATRITQDFNFSEVVVSQVFEGAMPSAANNYVRFSLDGVDMSMSKSMLDLIKLKIANDSTFISTDSGLLFSEGLTDSQKFKGFQLIANVLASNYADYVSYTEFEEVKTKYSHIHNYAVSMFAAATNFMNNGNYDAANRHINKVFNAYANLETYIDLAESGKLSLLTGDNQTQVGDQTGSEKVGFIAKIKNLFGKKSTSSVPFDAYLEKIHLPAKLKADIKMNIQQFESQGVSPGMKNVCESVATKLCELGFGMKDQVGVGKQYARASMFYLMSNGASFEYAANFVGDYMQALYDKKTTYREVTVPDLPFKVKVNENVDAKTESRLIAHLRKSYFDLMQPFRETIREVVLNGTYNPYDVYWEYKYKDSKSSDNFESAATGGGGCVYFWTGDTSLGILAHESGHCYDSAAASLWGLGKYGRISDSPLWRDAMKKDTATSGKESVTSYGKNSPAEDFAETVMLYNTNRSALKAFPSRLALMDKYEGSHSPIVQIRNELQTMADIARRYYGQGIELVMKNYYIYGCRVCPELDAYFSQYSAEEMYEATLWSSLLSTRSMKPISRYMTSIENAIHTIVNKNGADYAGAVFEDFLNRGNYDVFTRTNGVRADISQYSQSEIRSVINYLTNGTMDVRSLVTQVVYEGAIFDRMNFDLEQSRNNNVGYYQGMPSTPMSTPSPMSVDVDRAMEGAKYDTNSGAIDVEEVAFFDLFSKNKSKSQFQSELKVGQVGSRLTAQQVDLINRVNAAIAQTGFATITLNGTYQLSSEMLSYVSDVTKLNVQLLDGLGDGQYSLKQKYKTQKYANRVTYTGAQMVEIIKTLEYMQSRVDMSASLRDRAFQAYQLVAEIPTLYDYSNYGNMGHVVAASLRGLTSYNEIGRQGLVCAGYAAVYHELCARIGVDCEYVRGVGYGDLTRRGKSGGHAWNVVKIDGQLIPVDACWAACSGMRENWFGPSSEFEARHVADSDEAYNRYDIPLHEFRQQQQQVQQQYQQVLQQRFTVDRSSINMAEVTDITASFMAGFEANEAKKGNGALALREMLDQNNFNKITRDNNARYTLMRYDMSDLRGFTSHINSIVDYAIRECSSKYGKGYGYRAFRAFLEKGNFDCITNNNGAREMLKRYSVSEYRAFVYMGLLEVSNEY